MTSSQNKFNIGDNVRFKNKKARVLNVWWDGNDTYRYEVRFVVGKNLAGISWCVAEQSLEAY